MSKAKGKNLLVISALGEDQVGIVEDFSGAITDSGCNIEDSRMTVLGGQFAIIALVSGSWNELAKLESQFDQLAKKLGLTITARRSEERGAPAGTLPYHVEVVSMDHPGIVHNLARFFSKRHINIEDLTTSSYPAPHTGTPMFSVEMTVGVPAGTHIADLRNDFLEYCDELNLDALMEPVRG
ncbi:MAG: glycine cleavage system protein R [Pseudomonadota bacterium]|jgi:glycine cleavage system transcriptional repressor